ncbi:hypothetical protein [Azospirillum sp. SYSU D00513]|uniref:hypothetical protein n=1 Tax=Azospirillum sp. SYSU D00513 TaxID=2812561 RepID=UPI001A965037|nr:hypothetical protein [Azospirillum sp. SYSU D00513]
MISVAITAIFFTVLLFATFLPRWLVLQILWRWKGGPLRLVAANLASFVILGIVSAIAGGGFNAGQLDVYIRDAIRFILPFQAFWLIKDLLSFAWRKFRGDRRLFPRWVSSSVASFAIALVFIVLSSSAVVLIESYTGQYGTVAEMRVPGSDLVVGIDERSAHPFLAEYDRAVIVVRDGKEVSRVPMGKDVGGMRAVDVYRVMPDRLRLVDEWDDVFDIDLKTGVVIRATGAALSSGSGALLGSFNETDEPNRQFRFIPITEQPRPPLRYERGRRESAG